MNQAYLNSSIIEWTAKNWDMILSRVVQPPGPSKKKRIRILPCSRIESSTSWDVGRTWCNWQMVRSSSTQVDDGGWETNRRNPKWFKTISPDSNWHIISEYIRIITWRCSSTSGLDIHRWNYILMEVRSQCDTCDFHPDLHPSRSCQDTSIDVDWRAFIPCDA